MLLLIAHIIKWIYILTTVRILFYWIILNIPLKKILKAINEQGLIMFKVFK